MRTPGSHRAAISRGAARGRAMALAAAVALALAGLLMACTSGPPPGPDTMTAPMTVEQVRAEIEATKARIALPDGADWRPVTLGDGMYGPYAGAQLIEFQAMCAWFLEARDAKMAGDQARFGRAVVMLEQVPGWRSFSDPALMDDNGRTIIREGVAAARQGNFAIIGPFLQGNCTN